MKVKIGLLLILFSILSCSEKGSKKTIEKLVCQWNGKEVYFPSDSIFLMHKSNKIAYRMPLTKYKIVHYIDSMDCVNYALQLQQWTKFIDNLNTFSGEEIAYLFVFHCKNERELKISLRQEDFHYPVFFDKVGTFNKLNNLPANKLFHTFLLNKENKVMTLGNPIYNPKIKELYFNVIAEKTANKSKIGVRAKAEINKKVIDLGSFNWKQKQDAIFRLTNKGSEPLVIYDIVTSCKCTIPQYDPRPVTSGNFIDIKVTFKTEHPEIFNKTIIVHCNDENSPLVLHIKGKAITA